MIATTLPMAIADCLLVLSFFLAISCLPGAPKGKKATILYVACVIGVVIATFLYHLPLT